MIYSTRKCVIVMVVVLYLRAAGAREGALRSPSRKGVGIRATLSRRMVHQYVSSLEVPSRNLQASDATLADKAISRTYRIVGGQPAIRNRFPWMCSLRRDTPGEHFCGGSLIAPNVVLTAAHCLEQNLGGFNHPIVHLGRNTLSGNVEPIEVFRCSSTLAHPQWNENTSWHDLALCFLNGTSRLTPVKLANGAQPLTVETQLAIIGWGVDRPGGVKAENLQKAMVRLMDSTQCNQTYNGKVSQTAFCAGVPQGGVDACQGDSGGPIFLQGATPGEDVQMGVVSFGKSCGAPNVPGVYTDIRKYREWIYDQLKVKNIPYEPLNPKRTSLSTQPQEQVGAQVTPPQVPGAQATLPQVPGAQATPPQVPGAQATPPQVPGAQAMLPQVPGAGGTLLSTPPPPLQNVSQDPPVMSTTEGPCSCTTNGISGGVKVPSGCAQHGKPQGDLMFFCYVRGGPTCPSAKPSPYFIGATWKECTITASVPAFRMSPGREVAAMDEP